MSKLKFMNLISTSKGGHVDPSSEQQSVTSRKGISNNTPFLTTPLWHGLVLLVAMSLLITCVTSSQTPDGDWEDEDTIVVEVDNTVDHEARSSQSRVKRQTAYVTTYLEPKPTLLQPTSVLKGDSCISIKGKRGRCYPLKECYPFMYRHDLMNDGRYEGNTELARSIRDSLGSCLPMDGNDEDDDRQPFPFFGLRNQKPDLVCCTGPHTEINIPPMPPMVSPFITGTGRTPASKGQFPYMVAMMNSGRQFCGGSIVDQTHILTAAHCVSHMGGTELSRVTVQIGDHDIYSTADGAHQTKRVKRLSKHRQFSHATLHNDIAILTLSSPITYTSGVSPISPSSSSGSSAIVSGWGRIYDGGPFPKTPYYANVNLISNSACKQTYGTRAPGGITNSMLCAGSKSGDACSGDSGGPLVVGGSQIGVVSWGIGCGTYPGVYTRLSSFSPWIQKNRAH